MRATCRAGRFRRAHFRVPSDLLFRTGIGPMIHQVHSRPRRVGPTLPRAYSSSTPCPSDSFRSWKARTSSSTRHPWRSAAIPDVAANRFDRGLAALPLLEERHGTVLVRDLDSDTGVRINGHRVKQGRLHPGDEPVDRPPPVPRLDGRPGRVSAGTLTPPGPSSDALDDGARALSTHSSVGSGWADRAIAPAHEAESVGMRISHMPGRRPREPEGKTPKRPSFLGDPSPRLQACGVGLGGGDPTDSASCARKTFRASEARLDPNPTPAEAQYGQSANSTVIPEPFATDISGQVDSDS